MSSGWGQTLFQCFFSEPGKKEAPAEYEEAIAEAIGSGAVALGSGVGDQDRQGFVFGTEATRPSKGSRLAREADEA